MTTHDQLDRNLNLTHDGKTYVIAPPSIPDGRYISKVMAVGSKAAGGAKPTDTDVASLQLDDDEEYELVRRCLGAAVADEMEADGVDFNTYSLAGQCVMVWVIADKDTAISFWNTGGNPKAGKKPQDRKPKAKSAQPASTATKSTPAKPKAAKADTTS